MVRTTSKTYPIHIANGSVEQFAFPKSAVIICDANVNRAYPKLLKQYRRLIIPSGETSKRLSTIERLANELVNLKVDRKTCLIGIGGGVVGDITGFLAATYMRGIPYYLVPTTLLAMVDSSIGGKNGVDLASGKNLLGTTYQPTAVVTDPRFLLTLPNTQFSNGMAEVIKHGVLDASLLKWLEANQTKIQQRHLPTLQKLIQLNVEVKAGIVSQDEAEQSVRMLLNLGHTFGHAFETLSQYRLPHGQAVAIGLAYVSAYAKLPERERLLQLLQAFNLPITLARRYTPAQIVQTMLASDKKRSGKYLTLILPLRLGHLRIEQAVIPSKLQHFLRQYVG